MKKVRNSQDIPESMSNNHQGWNSFLETRGQEYLRWHSRNESRGSWCGITFHHDVKVLSAMLLPSLYPLCYAEARFLLSPVRDLIIRHYQGPLGAKIAYGSQPASHFPPSKLNAFSVFKVCENENGETKKRTTIRLIFNNIRLINSQNVFNMFWTSPIS